MKDLIKRKKGKVLAENGQMIEVLRSDGFKVFLDNRDDNFTKAMNNARLNANPVEVMIIVGMIRGFQISLNYAEKHGTQEQIKEVKLYIKNILSKEKIDG